jgi:single-strand DNA-binding protein
MRSVNKVLLMGHLAADPEVKDMSNGHSVTKFKIATNRDWKNSNGEKLEATDYHKIIAWSKLGEICGKFLKKGSAVYLEGRISNYIYKDKEGENKTITEIVADMVNFITYKKGKDGEQINLIEVPAV